MKIKETLAGGALAASLAAGCSAEQDPLPEGVLQFQTYEQIKDDDNFRSYTLIDCYSEDDRYHTAILRDQAPGDEPYSGGTNQKEAGPSKPSDLRLAAGSYEGKPYGVIIRQLGGTAAVYEVTTSANQFHVFNLDDGAHSSIVEDATPDYNLVFAAEIVEDNFGGKDAVFTTSCEPTS